MNKDIGRWMTNKRIYELLFIGGSLVSFFVWIIAIFIQGYGSRQFELFFSECEDFWADTLNVIGYSGERDPYHSLRYSGLAEKAYPPLVYMIYYLFSRLVDMQPYYENDYFLTMYNEPKFLIILFVFLSLQLIFLYEFIRTYKSGSGWIKAGTAIAVVVSAPMLFSIERANSVILSMIFIGIFIMWYDSENGLKRELSLIALAMAAAIKMTPAISGIVLLYNKQWKEAIRAFFYGLLCFLIPFFFFEGGLSNLSQMIINLQEHFKSYSNLEGTTFVATIYYFIPRNSDTFLWILKIMGYGVAMLLLFFCFYYKKNWEIIMAVSVVLLIFPEHSGYYCILYLFPAIIAFLNEDDHDKIDFVLLLGILLIVNDIQIHRLFDYHLGLLMILSVLLMKGFMEIKGIKDECISFRSKRIPWK